MRPSIWRTIILYLISSFAASTLGSDVNGKIGARLRMLLHRPGSEAVTLQKALGMCMDDDRWVKVFVEGESAASEVLNAGGRVDAVVGEVLTAKLPLEMIRSLAQSDKIKKIRVASPVRLLNDLAMTTVGADRVHAGQSPLIQPYQGEGVIVGIIDSGIDLDHEDFQEADGTTRILWLWDQNESGGNPPAGFNDGTEWTKAQIDASQCTHGDTEGHGTHVVGTAAGNGRALGNYAGMAPEADLIIVAVDRTTTGIVNGADYIYQKAESLGRPCVINVSLGGHDGPHDGTGLESRMLSQLVAAMPGRAFCAAAGNEGDDFIHLTYPATSDSLWSYYHAGPDGIVILYVRIPNVYLNAVRFSVGVDASTYNPMIQTGGPQDYLGRIPWYTAQDVINEGWGVYETAEFDGQERGRVSLEAEAVSDSVTALYVIIEEDDGMVWDGENQQVQNLDLWRFMAWGGDPRIHVWVADIGYPYMDGVGDVRYRAPDNDYSVGMPADGRNVIAVGASVNRNRWTNQGGTTVGYNEVVGQIAPFSSHGPTADGRLAPQIVAPGMGIASCLSSDIPGQEIEPERVLPGGRHIVWEGTSMSTPVVTGCVALYFQQNPNADHQQVLQVITGTAGQDAFTGTSLPDNTWGYGKISVFDMMTVTGIETPSAVPADFVLEQNVPNPFNPRTTIRYRLRENGRVRLAVFDLKGREKGILVDGYRTAGAYSAIIDGTGWASGIYVCRLETKHHSASRKIILMK